MVEVIANHEPVNLTAGVTPGNKLEWFSSDGLSLGTSSLALPTETPGQYRYMVRQKNPEGCYSQPAEITVRILPEAPVTHDVTYCQYHSALPLIATGNPGATLRWYTTENSDETAIEELIPTTSIPGVFTYYVSQEVNNVESVRVPMNIVVITLDPMNPLCAKQTNAFSPNGDQINDEWVIHEKEGIQSMVKIFNRWGEVVFESEGNKHVWNGIYRGKQLESGAYFYVKRYLNASLPDETGSVNLLK